MPGNPVAAFPFSPSLAPAGAPASPSFFLVVPGLFGWGSALTILSNVPIEEFC